MNDTQDDSVCTANIAGASDQTVTPSATDATVPASTPDEAELLRQKLAQMTEAAKRALADLQNYKKRVEEEKKSLREFAAVGLILELLPIVDNFARATASLPPELTAHPWSAGLLSVEKQLGDLLAKQGLKTVEGLGSALDPLKHEAVLQSPGPKDIVLAILENGYLIGDKVLKPAKVKVGNGEATPES